MALALTVSIYILLAAASFGWGKMALSLLGIDSKMMMPVSMNIWFGWATLLFLLQLAHFALPLTIFVVMPVLLIGAVLSGAHVIKNAKWPKPLNYAVLSKYLLVLLALTVVVVWVSSKAMLSPGNYDSGLYHFNKIRWLNTYPIIPGLGNLHGRLAFNQSFFHYVAALNFYPLFNQGRSVANSFLVLLTIVTLIDLLREALVKPTLFLTEHPFKYLYALLILPVVGFLAVESNGLASPSPDLISTMLQIVVAVVFVRTVVVWNSAEGQTACSAVFLLLLATTSITIKLSNLGFAAAVIAVVTVLALRSKLMRRIGKAFAFCLVILMCWCLQGIILSGAPLYPSAFGYVATDWAVPIGKVTEEANLIYSWARNPKEHWSQVLSNSEWLCGWFDRLSVDLVVYPFFAATVFMMVMIYFVIKSECRRKIFHECIILVPPAAGAIYWFVLAPDQRFAHGVFFVLSICAACLLLSTLHDKFSTKEFYNIVGLVFIFANLHYLGVYGWGMQFISTSGWYRVKEVSLLARTTDSGLVVYTPANGDQCWDSPLPATPYFNPELKLRKPGKVSSGFTVAAE